MIIPSRLLSNIRLIRARAARVAVTAVAGIGVGLLTMAAGPSEFTADQLQYLRSHMIDSSKIKQIYLAGSPLTKAEAANAPPPTLTLTTIPYWSTTYTSPLDNKTYHVSMVGGSPLGTTFKNTVVKFVPIVVRVHFPGGYTFDPGVTANCDTQSATVRFFASPLFNSVDWNSNGVDVGKGQMMSGFQRANYWGHVHGSKYGLTYKSSINGTYVVDFTASNAKDFVKGFNSPCGVKSAGYLDLGEWQTFVTSLAKQYAIPGQIVLIMTYDVYEFQNGDVTNCCVFGYHDALQTSNAILVWGTGAYDDSGILDASQDISGWSHELGELTDDPFVQRASGVPGGTADNTTPKWGHVGQDSKGCQGNLEVGDPLTGTLYSITGSGGFHYHYQDLAFHDWFYRLSPPYSTGSGYSFKGTFTGIQGACS